LQARVQVAALGLVTEVQPHFDAEADKLAKAWLATYGAAIKRLSHDRQESYRLVREMSAEPQDVDLVKPAGRFEPTTVRLHDVETALPTYKNHLLCDAQGNYPAETEKQLGNPGGRNRDEAQGIQLLVSQPATARAVIAGHRLPVGRAVRDRSPGLHLLCHRCLTGRSWLTSSIHMACISPMHCPSCVDWHLYAEAHVNAPTAASSRLPRRTGKLRVLDLTSEQVRQAIASAKDAAALFNSTLARDY
jgi:type III restriction enzyme